MSPSLRPATGWLTYLLMPTTSTARVALYNLRAACHVSGRLSLQKASGSHRLLAVDV